MSTLIVPSLRTVWHVGLYAQRHLGQRGMLGYMPTVTQDSVACWVICPPSRRTVWHVGLYAHRHVGQCGMLGYMPTVTQDSVACWVICPPSRRTVWHVGLYAHRHLGQCGMLGYMPTALRPVWHIGLYAPVTQTSVFSQTRALVALSYVVRNNPYFSKNKDHFASRKNQLPFSMAIGNVELVHECSHEHMRVGTARMRENKNKRLRRQAERLKIISKVVTK